MTNSVTRADDTVSWQDWKDAQDKAKAEAGTSLSMNDFYKLLAAQLQNQDMNNPMENSEMMNQMTQMAMMQAINDMTVVNTTTYAASMIGKEATFATTDAAGTVNGSISGVITSVDLSSYSFYLDGDEETAYPMSFLMKLHKDGASNVKPPEGDKDPEEPGTDGPEANPETPGTGTDGPGTTPETPGTGTDGPGTTPETPGTDTQGPGTSSGPG